MVRVLESAAGAGLTDQVGPLPDFRLGNVLATGFTGTLSERHGNAVERIPTPHRLIDWLVVNGLAVASCTTAQLDLARELRESIHAAATAAAIQDALPAPAVQSHQ